jgi:CBS domain-containing protein
VLIGLLSGLLSGVLTQLVYACEDGFLKLPIHWMWWPMLGGLVVGIGGLVEPQALGVGYHNIQAMLQGHVLPTGALLLLVVKAIIWSVALGSGTSGGVLAPLLIMGGAMGTALAGFLPAGSPGFWALLAMAATMGGTMRSPLTATFFAVELTGDTHVLLPLIAACGTAHAVTVLLMRRSILTEKVARRGHHLVREYRVDPFALTRVREVMTTAVESVPATMTLHGAARFLTDPATTHPSFPVVDTEQKVVGVIDPPAVLHWRRTGMRRTSTLGELLIGAKIALAHPDEYLESLADRLTAANVAHLPVVSREDGRLVGYIGWKDLMRVRAKLQAEERQRTSFFPDPSGLGRLTRARRAIRAVDPELTEPEPVALFDLGRAEGAELRRGRGSGPARRQVPAVNHIDQPGEVEDAEPDRDRQQKRIDPAGEPVEPTDHPRQRGRVVPENQPQFGALPLRLAGSHAATALAGNIPQGRREALRWSNNKEQPCRRGLRRDCRVTRASRAALENPAGETCPDNLARNRRVLRARRYRKSSPIDRRCRRARLRAAAARCD